MLTLLPVIFSQCCSAVTASEHEGSMPSIISKPLMYLGFCGDCSGDDLCAVSPVSENWIVTF